MDSDILRHPKVLRLMRALKVEPAKAIGHLACLFCNVARHAADGSLAEVDDIDIELWSEWIEADGRFAAALFETGILEKGTRILHGWRKRHEAMLAERARRDEDRRGARDRKRAERDRARGGPDSAEVTPMSHVTPCDGHSDAPPSHADRHRDKSAGHTDGHSTPPVTVTHGHAMSQRDLAGTRGGAGEAANRTGPDRTEKNELRTAAGGQPVDNLPPALGEQLSPCGAPPATAGIVRSFEDFFETPELAAARVADVRTQLRGGLEDWEDPVAVKVIGATAGKDTPTAYATTLCRNRGAIRAMALRLESERAEVADRASRERAGLKPRSDDAEAGRGREAKPPPKGGPQAIGDLVREAVQ